MEMENCHNYSPKLHNLVMIVDSSKIHQNHWIITEGFLHVIGNNMRVKEGNFPTECSAQAQTRHIKTNTLGKYTTD